MVMDRATKAKVRAVMRAVEAAPIVGANTAAGILGVKPPNFKRYRDRLTKVPVEGSSDVFVRVEVEALAAELREGR
jgi:hypothetical protein